MSKKDHYQFDDVQFEQIFKEGQLDPNLFSHEAHLRLAWIQINRYGLELALDNICTQILNYVKILGAEEKYNKTMTIASVRAVFHFMQKSKSTTFKDFIEEFPRLKYELKDLLGQHYSYDILAAKHTRHQYIEPDKLPFD